VSAENVEMGASGKRFGVTTLVTWPQTAHSRGLEPAPDATSGEIHRSFRAFLIHTLVTSQKQEYLHRQHNMLCFILDTPH
jgi:hypothetical protein